MWIWFINECVWYPVANVRRVYVLQVGNIVMVDRHVVRKALRGTSAVWKNFTTLYVGAACHPQPRVTGIANRLRRIPCFEEELMLCHVGVHSVLINNEMRRQRINCRSG